MKNFYLTFALVFGLFFQLSAALITYTGGGAPGDFNDPLNWDLGVVPGPTDDAVISGSGFNVILTGAANVASLEIKSGATFTVAAGSMLTLGNDSGATTNGSLDLDSATGTIINNGTISILNAAEDGIAVKGMFINNGVILIDGFGDDGISIVGGSFVNGPAGMITVTNGTGGGSSDYILVDNNSSTGPGAFVNDGVVDILLTMGDDGIELTDASTFDNNAIVNIIATGGDMGIRTRNTGSTFNNNAGSTLNITGTLDDSIAVEANTTLNNAGTIIITDSGDHATEVFGIFNNLAGGFYKAINSADDGIRVRSSGPGTVTNAGTITIDGFGSEAIEVDTGATFNYGGFIEIGCDDTKTEFEMKCNQDLGTACITFDICGTGQGTTYDFIDNFSSSSACPDSKIIVTGATAKLDFGTYVPVVGECYTIVDGSGGVCGPFAAVISSNPAICFEPIEYTATDVIVCIAAKTALAAELVSFKGEKSERGAMLSWSTATESNNAGFEVQRSTDGRNWSKLDYLVGQGNSSSTVLYNHLDKSPSAGVNYYRLKQIDFDGNFEYTERIALEFESVKPTFTFYPNPVKDVLFVDLNQSQDLGEVEIQLYDYRGQLLMSNEGMLNSIPFGDYESGVYFIHILSGTTETIQKIVK